MMPIHKSNFNIMIAITKLFLVSILLNSFQLPDPGNSERSISVEGTATVDIPVDYITFSVSYENENPDVKNLEHTSYDEVLNIKNVLLNDIGLPDSLIQTTQSVIRSIPNRNTFRFTQNMTIHLDSLELFDTIRRIVIEAGANSINIQSFGSYSEEEFQEKAFKNAYQNAVKQANLLASSSGLKLGDPIQVSTTRFFNRARSNQVTSGAMSAPLQIDAELSLESTVMRKTKEFTAKVNVQFELLANN